MKYIYNGQEISYEASKKLKRKKINFEEGYIEFRAWTDNDFAIAKKNKLESIIRSQYSLREELEIFRNKDTAPEAWTTYNNFIVSAKADADAYESILRKEKEILED